jgi:predicted DNA binding CopG/RHH family protein
MKKLTLTQEEKNLNAAVDQGKYVSVYTPAAAKQYAVQAKQTFAKQRTINLRVSERNLVRLKAAAAREGMSYQTFITSLLHKYV